MDRNTRIDRLMSLLFAFRHILQDKMSSEKEKISFLQVITLKYIKRRAPLMKEIAVFLSITPPSATSLVNTLIRSGYAQRQLDSKDRRVVRIVITKKGEGFLRKCFEKISQRIRKAFETLPEKELDQLSAILSKIVDSQNTNS